MLCIIRVLTGKRWNDQKVISIQTNCKGCFHSAKLKVPMVQTLLNSRLSKLYEPSLCISWVLYILYILLWYDYERQAGTGANLLIKSKLLNSWGLFRLMRSESHLKSFFIFWNESEYMKLLTGEIINWRNYYLEKLLKIINWRNY